MKEIQLFVWSSNVVTDKRCAISKDQSPVIVKCPQDTVIASVVFAGYGNPKGACGTFKAGDCHVDGVKHAVETLCVGKRQCVVGPQNFTELSSLCLLLSASEFKLQVQCKRLPILHAIFFSFFNLSYSRRQILLR